ncbi:MAG: hypothetical protein H6922_05680 [Pseudomonadaceae bacterium]|nr:hypothetical protein [Pseudomonadaceae bacterium]
MQALILFAVFGALLAAIAGVVTTSVESTRQFILNQVAATRTYFHNVEIALTEQVVPAEMQIAYQSCPDGTSHGASNVKSYLCRTEVSRLASWSGASDGSVDPWKRDITGYVLKKDVPIYASLPNYVITVPVTAMVLVSAGPDGKLSNEVQSGLAGLSTSSQIRDVLRIVPPDPASCNTSTNSCDDIVHTFTDQRALERRWKTIKEAMERIGGATVRHYGIQFKQFLGQLPDIYNSNIAGLFDGSGNLVINTANLNIWQGLGVSPPSLATVNLNSAADRTNVGVDEEFRYLTDPVAAGGSGMGLSFTVGSTPNGYDDMLTIDLTNNGSPWGGSTGTLAYRHIVSTTLY